MEIRKHFYNYIEKHNLTIKNIDSKIKDIGFVSFFNELTIACLGTPNFTHQKHNQTSTSLVYLSDEAKEKLICDLDVIYVSNLYYGIMLNENMRFNYNNYKEFLETLYIERNKLKREAYKQNQTLIYIIEMYMNLVYGMIDKPESIITCDMDNPREYITETAKTVMVNIVDFFINKAKPIYYIDTDEMFIPSLTDEEFDNLKQFFNERCNKLINTTVSTITIDTTDKQAYAIIFAKKKYILTNSAKTQGLKITDDNKILVENKKYFGKHYRDIFPEYTL